MLDFKPITIEDMDEINSYLDNMGSYLCDHSFVDMFLWKDMYQTKFCIKDQFLFLTVVSYPQKTPMYIFPIGRGNLQHALKILSVDATIRDIPLKITAISREMKEALETTFPNKYNFTNLRDQADYVYESNDMISLKGNKYHSKKNHINHFMKMYRNSWRYEDITLENIEEVKDYCHKWFENNADRKEAGSIFDEKKALKHAFQYYAALELQGGLLRLNGEIIAFSIGSQSKSKKDQVIVHFEKADSNISGSYQMINQQFAMANCQHVTWINREEDLGVAGLRKAKLSYYPAFIAYKYMATVKGDG